MKAIVVDEPGGPERLILREIPRPVPAGGQVLVQVAVAGVNYLDVAQRAGGYGIAMPFVPGLEVAGVVAEIGPGVTGVRLGDRVACLLTPGAYAEYLIAPERLLVGLPDGLDDRMAAATLLQGVTAELLAGRIGRVQPGQRALVLAAAGGVGSLLVQLLVARGAEVTGVTSPAKRDAVRALGAACVLSYDGMTAGDVNDMGGETFATTDQRFDVVFDGVGRATFGRSLDVLRPRGLLVLYGRPSGPVDSLSPEELGTRGSLTLARPRLPDYLGTRAELEAYALPVLDAVARGRLKVRVDAALPIEEAATAHRRLEGRQNVGKLLLLPS